MNCSLIALSSNLLVNLNICEAIRSITIFRSGNMLSSCNLINGSKCVSGVLPQTSTQ